jgi:hypothetical protein
MAMDKMERPTCGKLKVGDPVIVVIHAGRSRSEYPSTVESVARVWITVRPSGWSRTLRFRLDTQRDGSTTNYPDHFITPEQHAYDEQMMAARRALADAGIRFNFGSPFDKNDAATLALAERVAQIVAAISGVEANHG